LPAGHCADSVGGNARRRCLWTSSWRGCGPFECRRRGAACLCRPVRVTQHALCSMQYAPCASSMDEQRALWSMHDAAAFAGQLHIASRPSSLLCTQARPSWLMRLRMALWSHGSTGCACGTARWPSCCRRVCQTDAALVQLRWALPQHVSIAST
jgi:hypothetical protein